MNAAFELTHSNGIYIPHLSVSTINSWISDKYGFWNSKVERQPFKGNGYTIRGQAVEHAVNVFMETGTDDAENLALEYFDTKLREISMSRFEVEDIRDAVKGLARLAVDTYKNEAGGSPFITQTKISLRLDGVERDLVGYLDFYKPDVITRDCKVSNRTPSKLSQAYILQGAAYRKATGVNTIFDFFIDNKKPVYKAIPLSDDDYIFGISYLTRAAQALEELETCSDARRVMELMSFPNLDALWNENDKREAAKKHNIIYH